MKVKTLINKLKKCHPESEVVIANNSFWQDGTYVVTEIYNDGTTVEIETDYTKRIGAKQ